MSTHMTVEAVPVRVGLGLGRESSLLAVRSKQTVAVILEKSMDVEVACILERTVKQSDVT
jgi:hypothetical protein